MALQAYANAIESANADVLIQLGKRSLNAVVQTDRSTDGRTRWGWDCIGRPQCRSGLGCVHTLYRY